MDPLTISMGAAALCADGVVTAADLRFARSGEPADPAEPPPAGLAAAVADLERRLILGALAATGGNHSASARRLGLSRVGLLKMMRRHGLR